MEKLIEKFLKGTLKLTYYYNADKKKFDNEMIKGLSFVVIIIIFGFSATVLYGAYKEFKEAYSYFKGDHIKGMKVIDEEKTQSGVNVLLSDCEGLNFDDNNIYSNVYKMEYIWTEADGTKNVFGKKNINPVGENYVYIRDDDIFGEHGTSATFKVDKGRKFELSCKDVDYQTLQTVTIDYLNRTYKIDIEYFVEEPFGKKVKRFFKAIDIIIIIVLSIFLIKFSKKKKIRNKLNTKI